MADVWRGMDRDQFELAVEVDGRGLSVTITEPVGYEGFQVNLDERAARDLVDQLEAWREMALDLIDLVRDSPRAADRG